MAEKMKRLVLPIRTEIELRVFIDRIKFIWREGMQLQATIEPFVKKRTIPQNKKMWSSMIGDFADQGRMNGERYEAEDWHYFLKKNFLAGEYQEGITLPGYVKWRAMPDGELKLVGSTTDLTTKGMSEYLEKCYAFGSSELDIHFTISPKEAAMLGWSQ